MTYQYAAKADNVYMIDTHMFGYDRFQSIYIVEGKEIALIDAGVPPSWDIVKAGIIKHGFSIQDIAHVFVTHCEHPDHAGNVGALLKENARAIVYINPIGIAFLTDPAIDAAERKAKLPAPMAARFGEMVPVDKARIVLLKDDDVVDLGGGERLRAIFTPGHQPSGTVLLEEKNKGMFINDLPGAYFADADASWIFSPFRSDIRKALESLKKVSKMPLKRLFLGHFGICDNPELVIQGALAKMQQLLNIGAECMAQGKPDDIVEKTKAIRMLEVEKMRAARGEALYKYLSEELIPSMSRAFADYYVKSIGR